MNRVVIALAGLGCAATVVPAFAGSPVEQGRTAGTQLEVQLPHGDTMDLELRAMDTSDGRLLLVETETCDADGYCDPASDYSSALPASALKIDPSAATADLQTTLDGTPLVISWRPSNGAVLGGGQVEGGGSDATASQYAGTSADVSVHWGEAACTGTGGVGNGVFADTGPVTGDTTSDPVSAFHLPSGATVHCT